MSKPTTTTIKPKLTKLANMFESSSIVLERNTRTYWQLASETNGRIETVHTVGTAIKAAVSLEQSIGPNRQLAIHVTLLKNTFVSGKRRPKRPHPSTVTNIKIQV